MNYLRLPAQAATLRRQRSNISPGLPANTAFTLIELLVVIGIIAILMAIAIPMLAGARERGRRAACLSNVRQLIVGIHLFAEDNRQRLPSGHSEVEHDEHTPVLSVKVYQKLKSLVGSHRAMMCPWLGEPFSDSEEEGWLREDHGVLYGYVLGYNYLGGHDRTPWETDGLMQDPVPWESPQTMMERSDQVIVAELNAWSIDEDKTFAPHGARGAILSGGDSGNSGMGGISSGEIGAKGGNVGHLDGSAAWRHIDDMKIRRGSQDWGEGGCFTMW